tara:strand:+ start:1690 stop:2022 length:333 start_codon:yes stop_codon:yes gene_type:complete
MSDLNKVATRISSHVVAKDEKFGIDPVTISIIISIITNLVKLWWSCRSQDKVRGELRNPSWLFKLFLKREIRKQVKGSGRRSTMYGAFIDVGKNLSDKELNNILKEIGGK